MSLETVMTEHRRLVILRMLDTHGGEVNASILTDVCNQMGVSSTRDQVLTALAWLAEQGLVGLREGAVPEVRLAQITERGQEVATGRARVEGVKRPGPVRG